MRWENRHTIENALIRRRIARDNIDPEPIKRLSFRDRVERCADAIKEKASGKDPENW
jgi:hypothetical protein